MPFKRTGSSGSLSATQRDRNSFLHRVRQFTPIFAAASRRSLTDWYRFANALSAISALADTGSILTNLAYSGGIGAELLDDPGVEDWLTANDLTYWSEVQSGLSSVNQESSDIHGGSYAARLDVDILNSAVSIYQSKATVGDTYRAQFYAKATAAIAAQLASGANTVNNTLSTSWSQYLAELIAGDPNVEWKPTGSVAGESYFFDDLSLVKTSELDILVSGTTTFGVAGKQGQLQGVLGSEALTNPSFDSGLTGWSTLVTGGGSGSVVDNGDGSVTITGGTTTAWLYQNSFIPGQTYKITVVIDSISGAALNIALGGGAQSLGQPTVPGTYTYIVPAPTTQIACIGTTGCIAIVSSVTAVPYTTPHAVRFDGSTSKFIMTGPKIDGLTDMTLALEFYGFLSGLASKILAQKSGEFTIELDASRHLKVTRNRATTDATATSSITISQVAWHDVLITIDNTGNIAIWIDKVQDTALTGVSTGSGAFVSNVNPLSIGGTTTPSQVISGVLDESSIWNQVLDDSQIENYFVAVRA